MLVADRSLSPRTLDTGPPAGLDSDVLPRSSVVTQAEDAAAQPLLASPTSRSLGPHECRVYLFTLAFILQEMAGGISFDYASTAPTWLPSDDQHAPSFAGTLKRFLPELVGEGKPSSPCARFHAQEEPPVAHARDSERKCSCDGPRVRDDAPRSVSPDRGMQTARPPLCRRAAGVRVPRLRRGDALSDDSCQPLAPHRHPLFLHRKSCSLLSTVR